MHEVAAAATAAAATPPGRGSGKDPDLDLGWWAPRHSSKRAEKAGLDRPTRERETVNGNGNGKGIWERVEEKGKIVTVERGDGQSEGGGWVNRNTNPAETCLLALSAYLIDLT